ncbi:MAG: PEP/pyruvate-binding domain-containing protein [Gammaproteobacteria bacterium]|nr:PEP/pyruvate-binding domain-containing protein [Gammaproteobacteria bacterium]MBU1647190.1 PEP/pyruvate-binding domain-containing protein [Gammaproteobacteria bacterium]MBU1972702.1 PEP/pyruvate-binding domain-containing protein [Gammaproteobacteria bacterium]
MAEPSLHPSIVAMVSLAANIAANHPKKGLCQIERLRGYGISDEQIEMVVDIARHIRDEAGQMLDAEFAIEAGMTSPPAVGPAPMAPAPVEAGRAACCTPTARGNACC